MIYTLADGGVFGAFDGVADDWDWTFSDPSSGYQGMITLSTETPESSLEHRVVWEYDLSVVSVPAPVSAALTFSLRGASVHPFPDVDVHVYAYPADLQETRDDFHVGPALLQGSATVIPYQEATEYLLDVSAVVSQALLAGTNRVAFRFQVDPDTLNAVNQAFIDAVDSSPDSKPFLTIDEGPPLVGDTDADHDVDLDDYFTVQYCLTGPGDTVGSECDLADLDGDGYVDLLDLAAFQTAYTGPP